MMMNPYRSIDKRMAKVERQIALEFHNLRLRFAFDHLNVTSLRRAVREMYSRMDKRNRAAYIAEYMAMYDDASEEEAKKAVKRMLGGYNSVTEFVYAKETLRKAERTVEAMMSAGSRSQMREGIDRAQRLWVAQSKQYADIVVDEAMIASYKRDGIKRVVWITQEDERRCAHCRSLDGREFPIDDIPPKPHRNCRCYVLPVE
jgi:SPP1 gp7 family putative phage head morphogenesis protein